MKAITQYFVISVSTMDIFNALTMIGGLCLFLFGMNVMGQALERRAGNSLRNTLEKLTSNKIAGFLTGLGVTAVIQSSSATTVMVVGFVNSGLMTLRQAINVIMGANVGTTVTGWVLSLGGISSDNIWIRLLKPSSFTPVLALAGIVMYLFMNDSKKKDSGAILLGFSVLMFGMETMSSAVSGLSEVPEFQQLFVMFKNPLLGLLAGTLLTALIQSSSASVGILQALTVTGQVSVGAAIPIVMGDGIGTCVTAMISGVGTKREAKRAATVHLLINAIGSIVWVTVFWLIKAFLKPAVLDSSATFVGIAIINTGFKILNTALFLPLSGVLEKLVCKLIPDSKDAEEDTELDERLLFTPTLALQQCSLKEIEMARRAAQALKNSIKSITAYTPELAESIKEDEQRCDRYEDMLATYLVKIGSERLADSDSEEANMLLKLLGDFERISDHAVNLLESAEEMRDKKIVFSPEAAHDFSIISSAVNEILDLSMEAFINNDRAKAGDVEPLEQVIDEMKENMRTSHVLRMRNGECSMEMGFVWSDILTNFERVSDHCSNIAGCVIDAAEHNLNLHETLGNFKHNSKAFEERYKYYSEKYSKI